MLWRVMSVIGEQLVVFDGKVEAFRLRSRTKRVVPATKIVGGVLAKRMRRHRTTRNRCRLM